MADWFAFANNDFTAAKICASNYPPLVEIACYHCQQCAEKMLKGFLSLRGITPPKTHDLRELCRLSESNDSDFSKISQECILLSPYGVNVRYPNTIEVEESDMKKALAYAEKVLAFVEGKVKNISQR